MSWLFSEEVGRKVLDSLPRQSQELRTGHPCWCPLVLRLLAVIMGIHHHLPELAASLLSTAAGFPEMYNKLYQIDIIETRTPLLCFVEIT